MTSETTAGLRAFGLTLAFVTGMLVATQSRINGELGSRLGNGVVAALISFGTGLILLGLVMLVNRKLRARMRDVWAALRAHRLAPWQLMGGFSGAFLVVSQGVTVTAIGVASFTVAVVGGQLLSGLWVDRIGLGPAGKAPITRNRAIGAVVVVFAVVLASAGGLSGAGASILFVLLPALAGIGLAWQQAVNGRVAVIGGPIVAATVNFLAGTAALLLVCLVVVLARGLPTALPTQPWLYVGGAIGVVFIATAAVVVRWVGVLLLGLASIAGQLAGAVLLDVVVPTGGGLTVLQIVGCALTLVGVGIAAVRLR